MPVASFNPNLVHSLYLFSLQTPRSSFWSWCHYLILTDSSINIFRVSSSFPWFRCLFLQGSWRVVSWWVNMGISILWLMPQTKFGMIFFLVMDFFYVCVCFFFVFLLEKNLWDRRPTKPTPSELVHFPSPPLQGKKKPPNYTISATVPQRFNVESGSLHTCDWGPVTIALQELSLVEKVEPVKVRFTLRLRDQ